MLIPGLLLLLGAAPQAEHKEVVGDWLLTRSASEKGTCLASSLSGQTVLAVVLGNDGYPPMLMADNPQWPATSGRNFQGTLALNGGETVHVSFVGTGKASGVPTIGATLPSALREPFKAAKSIELAVSELKLEASFKISDAPKLWEALTNCVKNYGN